MQSKPTAEFSNNTKQNEANTPAGDFLALIKTTSPLLIQTTAYCTSLQELAANRYHLVDASQNVTVLKSLALSAETTHSRQEFQLQKTALSLDILESQQKLLSQQVALSQAYDDKFKRIQDRQDALSHELMEFHVQEQENYNHLTYQLSEFVDYINRGCDDKKGESGSSRGPQPPPDDRGRPGSGSEGSRPGGDSRIRSSGRRYYISGGFHRDLNTDIDKRSKTTITVMTTRNRRPSINTHTPQLVQISPPVCPGTDSPAPRKLLFSGNSHRFRPWFGTFEVALDSSCEDLSFHTTFGGCGWLVEEREVAARLCVL
ncbi:Cysteine-rich RLK (receptor-like protein kinase) 8 [Dorcoceras hygrometricum]|uniref:Cysteine-rich RLK (Receptor-like protein kinase) 8 n=1 Tax=Dorcoceras hygrometricum TaxID=472368 RepID=A0A2Z7BX93_9LAMI|nr:Cysteine-rich RLK (receptor-like protein kinase) 8 [Dorcoceras hygrometricum]